MCDCNRRDCPSCNPRWFDRSRDEQPAPAGADELREAEERVRILAQPHPHIRSGYDVMARDLSRVMAEYDERGRELKRLREVNEDILRATAADREELARRADYDEREEGWIR